MNMSTIIPEEISARHPELVALIKETESMEDGERQYWFDIMPSMTESQIGRLCDILNTEKTKLNELDAKYLDEIISLNESRLNEYLEPTEAQRANLDGRPTIGDSAGILDVLNRL